MPLTIDIRECREKLGISQRDLAKRIGVSDVLIVYWESGKRQIDPRFVAPLSRVLGVDPWAVLETSSLNRCDVKLHFSNEAQRKLGSLIAAVWDNIGDKNAEDIAAYVLGKINS